MDRERLLLQRLGSRGMLGRHLLQSYCSCQGALVACCVCCLLRLPQRLLQSKAVTWHRLPWLLLLLQRLLPLQVLRKVLLLLLRVGSRWLQLPMLRCLPRLRCRECRFLLS